MTRKFLGLALAAGLLGGCSDQPAPVEPRVEAPLYFVGSGSNLEALRYEVPRSFSSSATRTIGPEGGWIVVSGAVLRVPAGALSQPTSIDVTVPAGDYLQVQFAPHGLLFAAPVRLYVSLDGTPAEDDPALLSDLVLVYVGDALPDGGALVAQEVIPIKVYENGFASVEIGHFSGYVIATGEIVDAVEEAAGSL